MNNYVTAFYLSRVAALLIIIAPLSFIAGVLELWLHFLPESRVILRFHSISQVLQLLWVVCGLLGTVVFIALWRVSARRLLFVLGYAALYIPVSVIIWQHYTLGLLALILSIVLTAASSMLAVKANSNF